MAFMPGMMPQPGGAAKVEEEEEQVATKTAFTVKLMKFEPTKKVALIKEIKVLVPDMNLVQAKKFVEVGSFTFAVAFGFRHIYQ